jgi:hypothetical protein
MRLKAPAALLALLFLMVSFIPSPAQAFSLGLEPSTGTVGMDVKIPAFCQYGEGDYYLYWGESNQLIAQGTVDAKGCTPIYFKVPQTSRGKHTVTLKVGTRSFTRDFTITGTVALSIKKGPVGSQILVQGFGFENQEGGIHITYDGNNVASSIAADRNGSWQYTLKIPVGSRGNHVISASGPSTTAQEVGNRPFEVSPTIAVNPPSGWVGRVVNISGVGFGNGESNITVLYDDLPVKSGLIADSAGSWQSSFSVPASSKGTHKLDARGNMTTAEEVPEVKLNIAPGIRVEQTSGKIGEIIRVGDTLLVSGIGFQANESNIAVTFDGIAIIEKITGDAQGSWSTQFSVPATNRGEHIVKSSGDATRSDDVTPYTVVVTPYLEVNPNSGPIGSSMVLSGNGFSSNQPIAFIYDARKVDTTATTDYKGNINTSFKPPVSKAGAHVLIVSDAGGASGTVTINIESTPPATPSLISPKESTVFSLFENKPVDFSWASVDDPSGVVYTFELSQKLDFSGAATHKENLDKPLLSLHINERPMAGKYFWRVKAVDLAGNASDWSKPQSIEFTGFEYLWIGAIGLGVLLLAGLIIWRIRAISKKGGWSSESDSDS